MNLLRADKKKIIQCDFHRNKYWFIINNEMKFRETNECADKLKLTDRSNIRANSVKTIGFEIIGSIWRIMKMHVCFACTAPMKFFVS